MRGNNGGQRFNKSFGDADVLGSVKKRNASSPPSRPTPLCFIPPNGTRRSRKSQELPRRSGVDLFSYAMGAAKVLRPDAGSEPVVAIVSVTGDFFFAVERRDGNYRPDNSSRFVRHETGRSVMTVGWKK